MNEIDLTHVIIGHDSHEMRETVDEDARRVSLYLMELGGNLAMAQSMLFLANNSPVIFALRDIRRKGRRID